MAARVQPAFWSRVAGGDQVRLFELLPDVSFFTRSFRRIVGLTPSAYRVAHQSPRPAPGRRR